MIAATNSRTAAKRDSVAHNACAQAAITQRDRIRLIGNSMQEMVESVHRVSEDSNRASSSAGDAIELARQGGAIVHDALINMNTIAESVKATTQKDRRTGEELRSVAGSLQSSMRLQIKPICWRSMRPSKRRAPENRARLCSGCRRSSPPGGADHRGNQGNCSDDETVQLNPTGCEPDACGDKAG